MEKEFYRVKITTGLFITIAAMALFAGRSWATSYTWTGTGGNDDDGLPRNLYSEH